MKNYNDFKKDLLEDESLRMELKKALGTDDIQTAIVKFVNISSFAAEHGYEITPEDVAFEKASRRDLSEDELTLVSGGGYADLINFDSCDENFGCYNDFGCNLTQHIKRGGYWSPGVCLLDYGCSMTYNTCVISNECSSGQRCHTATI